MKITEKLIFLFWLKCDHYSRFQFIYLSNMQSSQYRWKLFCCAFTEILLSFLRSFEFLSVFRLSQYFPFSNQQISIFMLRGFRSTHFYSARLNVLARKCSKTLNVISMIGIKYLKFETWPWIISIHTHLWSKKKNSWKINCTRSSLNAIATTSDIIQKKMNWKTNAISKR